MPGAGGRDGIYDVVRRIPRGRVATYGQIARLAGMPGHARQVGYALNDLPAGSPVPWHRVINAAGRVSGRAEPLDEQIQRRLLECEKVAFDGRGRVALSRFLWTPQDHLGPGGRPRHSRLGVSSERLPRVGAPGATTLMAKPKTTAGIGDDAVRAKTGKSWPEWFAILDAAGATGMTHREIARHLADRHGRIGGWWCQMVTVAYERARGMREKHETTDGFSVGCSRTLAVPKSALYKAWKNGRVRARWLTGARLSIRKATPNKTMRISWGQPESRLEVYFYAKGAAKAQVTVQHSKLASAQAAVRMKAHWAKSLDRLKDLLER